MLPLHFRGISRLCVAAFAPALAASLLAPGCSDSGSATDATGTSSTTSEAATTTGSGGAGGAGGDSSTDATTTSSTSSASGTGGSGGEWPSCDSKPADAAQKTLNEIWQDDPQTPTPVWVPGVFVTAISGGACIAGTVCEIFVQQQETFADLVAGAQQSLKLRVSKTTADHFEGLAVGDQIDVYARAYRDTTGGQHELLLEVTYRDPGCAKKVGTGTPVPVLATLPDLTLSAYEDTLGPLLVQVDTLVGTPHMPEEIFAIFESGVFTEAGVDEIMTLSPYYLPGSVFVGLSPELLTNFTSVVGVFNLYVPLANPVVKYKQLCPRTMTDVIFGGQ